MKRIRPGMDPQNSRFTIEGGGEQNHPRKPNLSSRFYDFAVEALSAIFHSAVRAAGDGVSIPLERTNVLIDFLVLDSGSCVQFFTMFVTSQK